MDERLTLGYREATAATGTPWLEAGERLRGHEFHYSRVEPDATPRAPAWTLRGARRASAARASSPARVQASYLHVHWAAHPQLRAALRARRARGQPAAA